MHTTSWGVLLSAVYASLPDNRTIAAAALSRSFAVFEFATPRYVRPLQGRELFRRGVLSEAILALEAAVRRSPGHTAAWRLLGTAHAENEDDVQVGGRPRAATQLRPVTPPPSGCPKGWPV